MLLLPHPTCILKTHLLKIWLPPACCPPNAFRDSLANRTQISPATVKTLLNLTSASSVWEISGFPLISPTPSLYRFFASGTWWILFLPLVSLPTSNHGFNLSPQTCSLLQGIWTPTSPARNDLESATTLGSNMVIYGTSWVVQWLRLHASTAGGTGLTYGWKLRSHIPWRHK